MKEALELNSRTVKYINGISTKIPNRRITTIEEDGGLMLQFLIADDSPAEPRALFKTLRGKVSLTTIKLSDEAAWVLMIQLAETFGVGVYKMDRW